MADGIDFEDERPVTLYIKDDINHALVTYNDTGGQTGSKQSHGKRLREE
ncbi:hypothetical protein [Mucilaginibacter sp. FT3.2]|nr:hypothetical protein [Mucilaginibacter sp. FT3.2]MBB6231486.1 hypothetical protein [Mucilaginibacter sp. FT3.2]